MDRPLVQAHNLISKGAEQLCQAAQMIIDVEKSLRQDSAGNLKKLMQLREMVKIQTSDGTWNHDEYMHGMANGLILAEALFSGGEAKLLSAPKRWAKDKYLETRNEKSNEQTAARGSVREGGKDGTSGPCAGEVIRGGAETIRRN